MLIALGAAGVVGTSWIFTASAFFREYGPGGEILGLVVAGLLAGCIALAYAEMVSRYPKAGGEVVFALEVIGPRTAFVAGWLLIGAFIGSLAFYVAAAGFLLSQFFPVLETIPLYHFAGEAVYLPSLSIGICLTFVIWFCAHKGMELAGNVQVVLFTLMLAMGLALVITGFSTGSAENIWPPFQAGTPAALEVLRFVLPSMGFVTGFSLVAALAEDANVNPRQIGWATVGSIVVACLFMCSVLLATAWLIPWHETAQLQDGVIGAFRTAGYPFLSNLAFAISFFGLLTTFLALFPASSRLVLALARAGLFPRPLAKLNRSGQPGNALLFILVLTLCFGLLGRGALIWFIDLTGVFIGFAWFITVVCLYKVRRMQGVGEPARFHARPSWLPAVGAVAAVLVVAAALIPGTTMSLIWPYEYAMIFVWVVLGAVAYWSASRI